jgi:hypothetical protein
LEEIAKFNLEKSKSLFDEGAVSTFDRDYPACERFPRSMRVSFAPDEQTGRVQMLLDGVQLGDSLSDNTHEEDGYRYHDALHLAFLAHLGWSPVLRRLLKRKRKSKSDIDENEDGARAAVIEEAVSAIIFSSAEDHQMFIDIHSIPFGLLRTIQNLVGKFEVKECSLRQWQKAIWYGCKIYEELYKNKGGEVEIDLDERRIEYVACPPGRSPSR